MLGLLWGISCPLDCAGYSVLTHEAIVDAEWNDGIEPLLLTRFPYSTLEELQQAHAYAYGGAIIQDMGYYPFGSRFFSDLTHYVRSGDFVLALIEESKDLNEYAFALGALSHYAADTSGHQLATNRAVALMYPGLAKKYGPVVTYEEKPSAHMKVEYGFDVDQVAEGNYAPKAYHDFIGFEVSKPVLERAFTKTYSLDSTKPCSTIERCCLRNRETVFNYQTITLIRAQSPKQGPIDSLMKLTPSCWTKRAASLSRKFCGKIFSPITPILKSLSPRSGTRRDGTSSLRNWIP